MTKSSIYSVKNMNVRAAGFASWTIIEVDILENIITNVKASNMINELEILIKEMIENIGKIRQNRETNSSAVK